MPSLSIEVNDLNVATISLAGLELVDVFVHGGLDSEENATLTAIGGNYSQEGSRHLIWIPERALLPGEVVTIRLDETCDIATQGKTIAELYPDEAPSTQSDFSISDEIAAEIRARPRLHEGFTVQVETSSSQQATAISDDLNTDFRFSVLWSQVHPDQVRVRMGTYCFDDVLARRGGTAHLQTTLSIGDGVSFSVLR